MIGRTLAHYRILERLGAGGMGEVFLAEDLRLHRQVALKVLLAEVAADPERLHRFEREARAVAALNHPNIVTLYSIEEADGVRFLTMELVRGRTLAAEIPDSGIALTRLLQIAVPLSDALAAGARGHVGDSARPGPAGRRVQRRSARRSQPRDQALPREGPRAVSCTPDTTTRRDAKPWRFAASSRTRGRFSGRTTRCAATRDSPISCAASVYRTPTD
jgi:hypothetical protein